MLSSPIQRAASTVKKRPILKDLSIAVVLFGSLVRLVQYLSNRSLWGDEAMLALNIVDRSYLELLTPLDYNQAAPPLFLWIERFAVQVFGNNEYALRLFPFLCGLVSLVAFFKLTTRYGSAIAAPIAIALFACLKYTLYYANEAKQYSSDVMVALLLCLWLIPLKHQQLTAKQLVPLGIVGAVFIWLSHPTIFIMAGIEASYLLIASNPQRRQIIVNRLPMYLAWLFSFLGVYFFTIRGTLENDVLTDSWDNRYPNSLLDVMWAFDALGRFFYNPLGFLGFTDGVAIFAFIVGCVALYYRDRIILLTIAAPILVTLFASYLNQYPFRERLVLFLAPLAILIIAEGIALLIVQFRRRHKLVSILGACVFFILLLPPFVRASQQLISPLKVEEIRPVMTYIKSHQTPGDRLYVYPFGKEQFLYYAPKFGYAPNDYVMGAQTLATGGRNNRELSQPGIRRFRREIRSFRGQERVWFLFSNTSEMEEQAFLSVVESWGEPLDRFEQPGAFVYLYDLE
ncbi:MAG: hypothetical protein Kow00121_66140 [Elainellaceae cyanobacterium]